MIAHGRRKAEIVGPGDAPGSRRRERLPLLLANAVFYLAFLPAWRTARVRWRPPPERLGAGAGARRRPLVFVTWHRFAWCALIALRELPDGLRPANVAHDGLASRLNQRAGCWLGVDTFVYERAGSISPRDQLVDAVTRRPRNLLLFPDSGGPYGHVKPGVVEISRRIDARIVPFTLATRGTWTVGRALRHVVPLPLCSVEVVWADPLDGRTATREDCQAALEGCAAAS